MYSTAKDSMEDEADEDDFIMGELVDELALDDLLVEDKQDFRMVADAVQKRRIQSVQQTWQAIKKSQRAKAKAKARAKAKGKAKGKGKDNGSMRKFLRPRVRKRPRAPDENGREGSEPQADDQDVDMEGSVPGSRSISLSRSLTTTWRQEPGPAAVVPEEVAAMPLPATGDRVVVPRGPQQSQRQRDRDTRGVRRPVECAECPKVAGDTKNDPNPESWWHAQSNLDSPMPTVSWKDSSICSV